MSGTGFGQFGDDGSDQTAPDSSVGSLVDASTGLNSGWSFDIPKTADTATTNAVTGMAPVTANNTASNSDFAGFWSKLAGSVINTGVAVVAQKNGLVQPGVTTPVPVPPPNPNGKLLLIAIAVGAVLLLKHKAA